MPPAQLVLVSGISGFIAFHCARELLQHGYRVRGTVRSLEKANEVRALLAEIHPQAADPSVLDFAIVKDIALPNAFDHALEGVDHVLHTASPFHYNVTDPQRDLIDPAVKGTVGILESIIKYGKSVKRVVITSSVAAIRTSPTANPAGLSELDWNTGAVAQFESLKEKTPANIAYPASKTLAEQAAWKFVKGLPSPAPFTLTTINPPFVFGPPLHPCTLDSLNTSVKIIHDFYANGATTAFNPNLAVGMVDVRDVAKAHVRSLTQPLAEGERILVSSGPFTHQMLVDVLKKRFPGRVYPSGETTAVPLREVNDKSKKVLGMEYIDFETSVVDTVETILKRFG